MIKRLGYPAQNLFQEGARRPFKHYRSPISKAIAEAINKKYERMSANSASDDAMFLYCYHLVKEQCPKAAGRLDTFLYLYGFARNLSLAFFLSTGICASAAVLLGRKPLWWIAGASLLAGITFLFRYLKFYRHFSVEVFSSFLTGIKEG
jgi:hypothetical protein